MKYVLSMLQAKKEDIIDGLHYYKSKLKDNAYDYEIKVIKNEVKGMRANLSEIDKAIIILNKDAVKDD